MKFTRLVQRKLLTAVVLAAVLLAGCGGESDMEEVSRVIEEAGAIESGDICDPNHNNFAYDAYEFEAETLDQVRVEVSAEGFSPLLKLVEVSTGAVIAEWDSEYETGFALTYTIAGQGSYEARIYAMENGEGHYTLTITVAP